ncbi:MAG: WHG domain-containing protein [Acidimicrobiales bacterium]|jgi:AcrR family transcriptional regulator|nr:WHG domain-containing protein [Acidimicrobiales bacterium]
MARRRGLDRSDVILAALTIADADGLDALSLKAVADSLDVQSPSLYSHVDGLNGLLDACAIAVTAEFGEILRNSVVGVAGDEAVAAFAHAYRRWATENAGRYELSLRKVEGVEKREAGIGAIETMDRVLGVYGLSAPDATAAGRTLRAAVHGFSTLEAADALGRGPNDASFDYLVALLLDGIRANASSLPRRRRARASG